MPTTIENQNWWQRRSNLERGLTLLCFLIIISAVCLAIGLFSLSLSNELNKEPSHTAEALQVDNMLMYDTGHFFEDTQHNNDLCLSAECVTTASNILSSMDPTVNPCDDFYQFSCGKFLKKDIPENKMEEDTFTMINDALQEQLRPLFEKSHPDSSPKHLQLPNKLYSACMNTTRIEELGHGPIQEIATFLGGWPVIMGESWNPDNLWTWEATVKKFRKLGFNIEYILNFSVVVDLKNSTRRMLNVDQSEIGLPREFLVKGFNYTLVTAYYNFMVETAVLLGARKEIAQKELRASLQFEMDLANINCSTEKRRNASAVYNLRTVKDLQTSYPYISWKDYINTLLPEGLDADDDEPINVSVPSYFEELGLLLARTPNRTIANYLMWRIHKFSNTYLSQEFRKIQLDFIKAIFGSRDLGARWKECIYYTIENLPIAVGSLYVREYFKENAKQSALEMVNNIKSAFKGILRHVDWMDEQTRESAIDKLNSMITHIGYPDELTDNSKLEEYYNNLDIDVDNYLKSILKLDVFKTDKSFGKLRFPVNKTDWTLHANPAVLDGSYSFVENSIKFSAGAFQGKLFHIDRPKYMNYGAIGYVIGHEITHGFDDQGRQFDLNGNLIDWWDKDTKDAYLNKARCIIDQYANYTEKSTGLKLNGINTQGENIADNGGIKESYIAYTKWVNRYGQEPNLPGLDFSPQQMFWISAAQTYCAIRRKEIHQLRVSTDIHSPPEFRILGPLRNMKEFASDFQCLQGSPMNPLRKCEVW